MSTGGIGYAANTARVVILDPPPNNISRLLVRYHGARVPPLDELVQKKIIEIVNRGFVDTRKIPVAIMWPTGDSKELSSWSMDKGHGLDDHDNHGAFCLECCKRRSKSAAGGGAEHKCGTP